MKKGEVDDGKIASYFRQDLRKTYYVAQVPGDGGVDWGWTDDPSPHRLDRPIKLSAYWQARFLADAKRCRWAHAKCS